MSVLVLLLTLSVASWYLIITKSIGNLIASRRANAFLERFWQIDSLSRLEAEVKNQAADHAFIQLAKTALAVTTDSRQYGMEKLAAAGGSGEWLTRA